MVTSKEKPKNHPSNDVHTDIESFILFNDSGLNDLYSQLIEVEEIIEISYSVRAILDEKWGNQPTPPEKLSNNLEHGLEYIE